MALESENTWHVLGTEVSRRHGCLRTEGRMRAPSLGAEAQVLSVRGSEGLLSLFAVCGWEGAGGGAVDPHLSRKGFSDWWWGRRWGPGCVWGGASRRSPRVRVGGWLRRWWVWVMLVVRATGWIGGGR